MNSPKPFRVSICDDERARVIAPHGELDMHTVPDVQEAFNTTEGVESVILDLRGLTFMDSQGLRAILWAVREYEARGISLKLVPGGRNVQRVFDITGTTNRLTWVDDQASDEDSGNPLSA